MRWPFDEVHDVRASFFHLVDALHIHAGGFEHVRCAGSRDQLESHVDELASDRCHVALVVIGDADEDGPLRGQFLSRSQLSFGERFAEIIRDTHDFAGRFHLRPKHGIDAGKLAPGKHRGLHVVTASGVEVGAALDEVRQKIRAACARSSAGPQSLPWARPSP